MDLTAIITTLRHGEKNDAGELTSEGHVQARRKGVQTDHLKGGVMLFHSGVARVRDTVRSVSSSLANETEEDMDKFIEDSNLQDYVSPFLHYLVDPQIKGDYFSNWDDIQDNETARLARIKDFLEFGQNSPEDRIALSPLQMAKNVTRVIVTQIDFALITEPSVRTNFINGSHEPVISAFLYYFLNGFMEDEVKWFGKTLEYAEGFEIKIYEEGVKHKINFNFRDRQQDIDLSELRKFIK